MENQKVLGIIGVQYPYALSESFFHEELVVLSQHFPKVTVFLTDTHLIPDKKVFFEVPENVELVELGTERSILSKVKSLLCIKPIVFFQELEHRKKKFNWKDKVLSLKTVFYYENRSSIFLRNLLTYLTKNNILAPDIIFYSYWLNEFTYGLTKLKKSGDFQIYSRVHGWDLYEERHTPPFLPFRRSIISKLDGLFPISEQGEKYLITNFQLEKTDNIHVAYLGTPSSEFNSQSIQKERLEILSIAFLSPVKNIEILIETLSSLEIPFRWTHIGDRNSDYDNEIKKLAHLKIPNANEKIKFIGAMKNKEIKEYLISKNINVLINTSYSEGIPVSMMEALSCHIPVIGPSVGGIPELITPECGILLSEKPDSTEIKVALVKLFQNNSEERNKMREAAHQQWSKKFNSKINYSNFADLLKGKFE
jgi:glycosyltransferase involved in cell wall biosynthesis